MKTIFVIVGVILLSFTAHAQNLDRPQLRLKPLNNKLELNYLGKDSSTNKLNSFEKPGNRYSLYPKPRAKSADTAEAAKFSSTMPVMVPDSTIRFSLLALKPDSTITFPMPVLKP